MPKYCYNCKECSTSFEVWHSMSFEDQTCVECSSSEVFRVPSLAKDKQNNKPPKTGAIVDKYISDVRKEVEQEKTNLRNREL